jgi:hypothetical protein
MQRQDYLLRLIQQMGRTLARIREMLLAGRDEEAGAELATVAQQAGIDLRFVIALEEASLRPLLLTGGEIDRPKCALFAELVYLEWRRSLAAGRLDYAERCAKRSLLLFQLAYQHTEPDDETREKMQALAANDPSLARVSNGE